MTDTPTHKVCRRCAVDKPLEDFSPIVRGKFGRAARCRKCEYAVRKPSYRTRQPRVVPPVTPKLWWQVRDLTPTERAEMRHNAAEYVARRAGHGKGFADDVPATDDLALTIKKERQLAIAIRAARRRAYLATDPSKVPHDV